MLLCKYFDPKLGYETEEKVKDDEFYSFANRTPDINQAIHCIKVVASGLWLDRIKRHFSGLPLMETGVYSSTVAWYGDHAKFIAGNIADVNSAYFQNWMRDKKSIDDDIPCTICGSKFTPEEWFNNKGKCVKCNELSKLEEIQILLNDHSINDLERNVKIQEVLDGSR